MDPEILNSKVAQTLLRPGLNHILKLWGQNNAKHYDIGKTIVVAGSGRGGSTWLAEIIGTLPGYPILWEPLHPGKNPECQKYGFTWRTYIPTQVDDSLREEYIRKILTGANLSTQVVSSLAFHSTQYLRFRGFVVKFVNANLLLYWLLKKFPMRALLLLRHPCAVVSSQLRHSAWRGVRKEIVAFPKNLAADYPHLSKILQRIETREEVLAFEWALKTYIPLIQPQPHPWLLTTYEQLVEGGKQELERIFQFLGEPTPQQAYKYLKKPSQTTQQTSHVATGKNPLVGWQENLNSHQIERILDVVHQFGIDFYTDSLLPDYEKLKSFILQS